MDDITTQIYFALDDAKENRYGTERDCAAMTDVLLEKGYLEGGPDAPRITKKGAILHDTLGELFKLNAVAGAHILDSYFTYGMLKEMTK